MSRVAPPLLLFDQSKSRGRQMPDDVQGYKLQAALSQMQKLWDREAGRM